MEEYIIYISKQTLFLALILTGPPVLVALIVGLTISIVQATTQIQEQTLTFVPKLIAVVMTLAISGAWMLTQLSTFATSLLESFPKMIH
jgi:flagellar biosynthesis protein FliQ